VFSILLCKNSINQQDNNHLVNKASLEDNSQDNSQDKEDKEDKEDKDNKANNINQMLIMLIE